MRYPATEKLESIRLVEQSDLPVRATLERLGISRSAFYQWYDHNRDLVSRKTFAYPQALH
jgi:transposase-like protein